MQVTNGTVPLLRDDVSGFESKEALLKLRAPQFSEVQHPTNVLRAEEKSLLNKLISGDRIAPEVTDASRGDNIGERQPIDDVGEHFGGGKDGICGGLICLSSNDP
jgi:hypothetical protein